MWKKWAIAAIIYLLIVMAGYGVYSALTGYTGNTAHQMEMK